MGEKDQDQHQQPDDKQLSLGEKASSWFKGNARQGDTFFTTAVLFADNVRTYITNYPDKDKVLPEPPLGVPYGFLEGAEVGVLTYVTLKPIQTNIVSFLAGRPQFSAINKPVGVLLMVGQFLVAAQMALYATVRKGSYTWLSTLEDFASSTAPEKDSSSAEEVTHKSAIADALCKDPLLATFQQQLAKQQTSGEEISATATTQKGEPPSTLDWIKGPDKVVVDQMALALAACNSRKPSTPSAS